MTAISVELSDSEQGDFVPLITPQKAAILGASNIMATWTGNLIKVFASGLVAVIISMTFIAIYQMRSASAELDVPRHIILVDATAQITPERVCVAESVVRRYPDVPCYLYLTSDSTPLLTRLADAYPNLYLRKWSWAPNMKGTPMEPLLNNVAAVWLSLLSSPSRSREMIARSLALWKYGGITLSLDWKMADDEDCLGVDGAPYNRVDAHATAFLRLENCHVLMEQLLVKTKNELERGRNVDAEKIFIQILRQICPSANELKEKPELCHEMQVYNCTHHSAAPLPTDWYDTHRGNCPLTISGNFRLEYINSQVALTTR